MITVAKVEPNFLFFMMEVPRGTIMDFAIEDLKCTIIAACWFLPVLFSPGYVIAHMLKKSFCKDFSLSLLVASSLIFSISIVPCLSYLLISKAGINVNNFFIALIGMAGIGLFSVDVFARLIGEEKIVSWQICVKIFGVIAFVGGATLLVCDTQHGNHLYPSIGSFDYAKDVSVTGAILHSGIPPVNPEFSPGHTVQIYYYYGWFTICAIVASLAGGENAVRGAVLASIPWCGLALISTLAVYIQTSVTSVKKGVATAWAIALLAVGGLQIIPTIVIKLVSGATFGTVNWSNEQVPLWIVSILWTPHHLAGFIAAITALMLFRYAIDTQLSKLQYSVLLFMVSISIGSIAALSIWMFFSFILILVAWAIVCVRNRYRDDLYAGLQVCIMAIPALFIIMHNLQGAPHTANFPIALQIRSFFLVDDLLIRLHVFYMLRNIADLALLPVNYFIEFGLTLVISAWYLLSDRSVLKNMSRNEQMLIIMALVGLFAATFLRSTLRNNDLGWRSTMFANFAFVVWSAIFFSKNKLKSYFSKGVISVLAGIGLCSTLYDVVMFHYYPEHYEVLFLKNSMSNSMSLSEQSLEVYNQRSIYEYARAHFASSYVEQFNPDVRIDEPHGLYAVRSFAVADTEYGTLFGINNKEYLPAQQHAALLFKGRILTKRGVDDWCDSLNASLIIITQHDPIWSQLITLKGVLHPLMLTNTVGLYGCGVKFRIASSRRNISAR